MHRLCALKPYNLKWLGIYRDIKSERERGTFSRSTGSKRGRDGGGGPLAESGSGLPPWHFCVSAAPAIVLSIYLSPTSF